VCLLREAEADPGRPGKTEGTNRQAFLLKGLLQDQTWVAGPLFGRMRLLRQGVYLADCRQKILQFGLLHEIAGV
jgi:hypothetical protein